MIKKKSLTILLFLTIISIKSQERKKSIFSIKKMVLFTIVLQQIIFYLMTKIISIQLTHISFNLSTILVNGKILSFN